MCRAANVPVACPMRRSTPGTSGHPRTARPLGLPADGQADPLHETALQASDPATQRYRAPRAAAPDRAYAARRPSGRPPCVLRGRGKILPAPTRGTPHPGRDTRKDAVSTSLSCLLKHRRSPGSSSGRADHLQALAPLDLHHQLHHSRVCGGPAVHAGAPLMQPSGAGRRPLGHVHRAPCT